MLSDDEKKRLLHRMSRIGGQVDAVRRKIPVFADRRPELYSLDVQTPALKTPG